MSSVEEKRFLQNLYKVGYSKISKINYYENKDYLIKSFQRRFRQNLINGNTDKECLLISKSLLNMEAVHVDEAWRQSGRHEAWLVCKKIN